MLAYSHIHFQRIPKVPIFPPFNGFRYFASTYLFIHVQRIPVFIYRIPILFSISVLWISMFSLYRIPIFIYSFMFNDFLNKIHKKSCIILYILFCIVNTSTFTVCYFYLLFPSCISFTTCIHIATGKKGSVVYFSIHLQTPCRLLLLVPLIICGV